MSASSMLSEGSFTYYASRRASYSYRMSKNNTGLPRRLVQTATTVGGLLVGTSELP